MHEGQGDTQCVGQPLRIDKLEGVGDSSQRADIAHVQKRTDVAKVAGDDLERVQAVSDRHGVRISHFVGKTRCREVDEKRDRDADDGEHRTT